MWGLPVRSLGFHCKSTIVLENIAYFKKYKKGYEVRRVGRATIDGIVREISEDVMLIPKHQVNRVIFLKMLILDLPLTWFSIALFRLLGSIQFDLLEKPE